MPPPRPDGHNHESIILKTNAITKTTEASGHPAATANEVEFVSLLTRHLREKGATETFALMGELLAIQAKYADQAASA